MAREPDELKKSGRNEYRTVTHDSLVISNGLWHWCSRGIGGKTAVDFLIKVRGMGFTDAVKTVLGSAAALSYPIRPVRSVQPAKPKKKAPFILPKANNCGFHTFAYLQNRGIDGDILSRCIEEGVFYQSEGHFNCVFVGKDTDGKPRFACMRGIVDDFFQDVEGSDKRYGFCVPSRKPHGNILMTYESPIDALSHATMDKIEHGEDWDKTARLSLGGVSPLALIRYLKDHSEVDTVCLCLDNDTAGRETTEKLKDVIKSIAHPKKGGYTIVIKPPPAGKDYNDALRILLQEKQEQSRLNRRKQAVILF